MHLLLGQIKLARSDVLVRVELDLLEADDARGDVDLAVRANGLGGEGVEDGYLRVRDRIRVVVAVNLPHVRLAAVEVQLLDLIQRPLDDVDRLLVQRRRSAVEARLADHVRTIGRIHDDEIIRRDRSQAHRIRGIRLIRPLPRPLDFARGKSVVSARPVNESALLENAEHLLQVVLSVLIGRRRGCAGCRD